MFLPLLFCPIGLCLERGERPGVWGGLVSTGRSESCPQPECWSREGPEAQV